MIPSTDPPSEVVCDVDTVATSISSNDSSPSLADNEEHQHGTYLRHGMQVIQQERDGLSKLAENLADDFPKVVSRILRTIGRVVVTGVGKSGLIGMKIAATLSSTGTPALFVHAGNAAHGDLGMISNEDIVVAISKSGESDELQVVMDYCLHIGVEVVAVTAKATSRLGRCARYRLLLPSTAEACEVTLAPTTSSTVSLALGDALAIVLSRARGFSMEDFSLYHPGGSLGKLSTRIDLLMSKNPPICSKNSTSLAQALIIMASSRHGCIGVVEEKTERLMGVVTTHTLGKLTINSIDMATSVQTIMIHNPVTADPRESAHFVSRRMRKHDMDSIFITHPVTHAPMGIVYMEDLK